MEIIRNAYKEIQFKELHQNDVFIAVCDGKLYMKTNKVCDDSDQYLNAVSLESGTLVEFDDWEKVRVPKKVVLTVD